MTRWVTSPKPKAELTPEPGGPVKDAAGNDVTIYRTASGVRFSQTVHPSGFVLWRKEVLDTSP
jgi:hypothetical protein